MKLLMILPSLARGGAEEQSLTIARAAIRRGWEVHAALPNTAGTVSLFDDFSSAGAICHALTIADVRSRWPMFAELKRLLMTAARLLIIKPDVAQIALPSPIAGASSILACALLRIPAAVVFHSTPVRLSFGDKRLKAYAWARRRAQQWIAVSEYSRKLISQSFETSPDEILRIYNGAKAGNGNSDRSTARQNLCLELGLREEDSLILTVGRLHPDKGYRELLHTIPHLLAEFPKAKFLWAGEGEYREELFRQIELYGIADAVLMLGHRSDVRQLMLAADLLAFPSHVESMSLVLLEAMAAGIPIVTSWAGGTPELISDQIHGLLCHVGDSCDLLAKLRWAFNHTEQMQAMAESARERVREFSEETMIAETLAVLEKLHTGTVGRGEESSVLFPS